MKYEKGGRPKRTGNHSPDFTWVEYEETPLNHERGFFWLRRDGLRLGFRKAGDYYKEGTEPKYRFEIGRECGGNGIYDVVVVIPFVNMIEGDKLKYFPSHVRIMIGPRELEHILEFDGVPVSRLIDDAVKVFDYANKKYPLGSLGWWGPDDE